MSLFEATVTYVDDAFQGKQKAHFERTVHWMRLFYPQGSEAHDIAAYAHDIERALRDTTYTPPDDYLDATFLQHHQERGAELMAAFLHQHNAPDEVIATVTHLIQKHEVGGDEVQNALMDADSVSFFETNAEIFVTHKAPIEGFERVKQKLDWMYDRIHTDEHKLLAEANYRTWSNALEQSKETA